MADKVTPGLGRFNVGQPSAANNPYLKIVEEAGKKLGSVGKGYAAAQAEIGKRKASALKLVPEADFTSDTSPSGMFAADAKEIEDKVNGVGEDAYDFSNLNDVARFEKDVAKLNKELKEGELLYDQIIKNAEDLELAHEVYLQTGKNPTINVQGEQVVNELVEGDAYDNTIFALDKLRNSEVVKEGGKYKIKINGETVEEYDSKEEYFEDLAKITKARYKRAPVVSPAQTLFNRKYAALYDTKEKARERINIDVKNELDNEALKYYAQEKGVDDLSLISREVGEDGLTDYQRFYAEMMEEEYVREQTTPIPTSEQTGLSNVDLSGYSLSQVSTTEETVRLGDSLGDDQAGPDASYTQDLEYQAIVLPKPINVSGSNLSSGYKIFSFAVNPVSGQLEASYKETQGKTRYAYKTSNDVLAPLKYADSEAEIPEGAIAFPEDNMAVDADENKLITIPIGGNLTGLGKEVYLKLSSDPTNIMLMNQELERHDAEAARKARVNQ